MASIEGVDFSRGGFPGPAALKAAGKRFVGRYAVGDVSPGGRGITEAEYAGYVANGIDVFLYWEAEESWMLGGWERGVAAAQNALANIRRAGMPEGMPVYYSHDIEPAASDFAAIGDCLRGAASVVGADRVGFYSGWLGIDHVSKAGTAKWFAQTSAWSGIPPSWHPAGHLQQYAYRHFIGGVECDDVRAVKAHYGQASDFAGTPPPPAYAKPVPPSLKGGEPFPHIDKDGIVWLPLAERRWTALAGTPRKQRARDDAADVGKPVAKGKKATFLYHVAMPDGAVWFVSKAGSRCRADAFVPAE